MNSLGDVKGRNKNLFELDFLFSHNAAIQRNPKTLQSRSTPLNYMRAEGRKV